MAVRILEWLSAGHEELRIDWGSAGMAARDKPRSALALEHQRISRIRKPLAGGALPYF